MKPQEARAIARAAYLFTLPLVVNYGDLYSRAVDSSSPRWAGGFGRWQLLEAPVGGRKGPTSAESYWQTWLDVRSQPCALSPRAPGTGSAVRCNDLWGFLVGETCNGDGASASRHLMLVSPAWAGDTPSPDDCVVRGESPFLRLVAAISRPQSNGATATPEEDFDLGYGLVTALQEPVRWWPWRPNTVTSDEYWGCANFVLSLTTPHDADEEILRRTAEIGVAAGEPWDPLTQRPEIRDAVSAGMDDAITDLMRRSALEDGRYLRSRSRTETDRDYFARALGAVARSVADGVSSYSVR